MIFFYIASALFAATFSLGVLVQPRLVDTGLVLWIHHGLFSAVVVSALVTLTVGFVQSLPYRWALLPALAVFVVLTRVRAGTPGHAALAATAAVFYAGGLRAFSCAPPPPARYEFPEFLEGVGCFGLFSRPDGDRHA